MNTHHSSYPIFLDHIFVLTEPGAKIAERLADLGLIEGNANEHPGQGTANRRFFFERFTFELLYISNPVEASTGAGRRLRMLDRSQDSEASPFGIIVRVTEPGANPPFQNWAYYPDYFDGKMCFHVGINSNLLVEPACICMPPALPQQTEIPPAYANPGWQLTCVKITTPVANPSEELACFAAMKSVKIEFGKAHHMTLSFNNGALGKSASLNPAVPVTIEW